MGVLIDLVQIHIPGAVPFLLCINSSANVFVIYFSSYNAMRRMHTQTKPISSETQWNMLESLSQ